MHAARSVLVLSLMLGATGAAVAPAYSAGLVQDGAVQSYATGTLAPFLNSLAALKDEIKAANADRKAWAGYSEDWKKWTPEQSESNRNTYSFGEYLWSVKKDKEFRAKHTGSKAALALKEFQEKSGGAVVEIFACDAKGANVAQSTLTSDWFQGDEEKFTAVNGKKDLFFAAPKRDESAGTTTVQVSVPLWDGETFIGFVCVGVVAEKAK